MRVIDSTILASFLRKESGWERIASLIMNSLSVDLIVKEVLNVLWKDYSLRRIIDRETVAELYKIMKSLVNVNIILEPEDKYVDDAFKIALNTKITVYDALYIAQAKRNNLELLTLDNKQKEAAESVGVKVVTL